MLTSLWKRLVRPSITDQPQKDEMTLYYERMEAALGSWRTWVLRCLSADNPRVPGYFNPPEGANLPAECEQHFGNLYVEWQKAADAGEPDFSIALIAAGLLACGRKEMARVVLTNWDLTAATAPCPVLPIGILKSVVPIPGQFYQWSWYSARIEKDRILDWLDTHEGSLRWDATVQRYLLDTL
jgi:hypothetical protein